MQPRLLRSRSERMLAGVCGGIAEYLNVDPTIVRLLFALVTILTGAGFFFYPLLWVIMPLRAVAPPNAPTYVSTEATQQVRERVGSVGSTYGAGPLPPEPPRAQTGYTVPLDTSELVPPPPPRHKLQSGHWAGIILIGIGAMIVSEVLDLPSELIAAAILMGIGAMLLVRRR
jgi:phage shock protein PspC (stress-responsive transcriptional regulator)